MLRKTPYASMCPLAVTLFMISIMALPAMAQIGPGDAGMIFEIDGDLDNGGKEDWHDLIDSNGDVIGDPASIMHLVDGTKGDDESVFAKSDKVFHNPNTYNWKGGSVPQKDDLQNCNFYIFEDAGGDLWVALSGDRRATNGNSYIDFELLQAELTKEDDGSFSSPGPHGGRTIGDRLITILLAKGGAQASFFLHKWDVGDGPEGFTYIDETPMDNAFVAANIAGKVAVNYGAFGDTTYKVNAFGEAALNMSKLIFGDDICMNFATLFIRTKSSDSPTAQLKDFCDPIPINICRDDEKPEVKAPGHFEIKCEDFDPGKLNDIDYGTPMMSDNCGIVDDGFDAVFEPDACLNTGKIIVTWWALDECGNRGEDTQEVWVVDNEDPKIFCSLDDSTACDSGVDPKSLFVTPTATDNCTPVADIRIEQVGIDMTTPIGMGCFEITRTWKAIDCNGNESGTCSQTILVFDNEKPVFDAVNPIDVECPAPIPSVADTLAQITATDNCSDKDHITITHVSDNTIFDDACTTVIERTYKAEDDCGYSDTITQTITRTDSVAPSVIIDPRGGDIDCFTPQVFDIIASDDCDQDLYVDIQVMGCDDPDLCVKDIDMENNQVTITVFSNVSVTISVTVKDDCDNSDSDTIVVTGTCATICPGPKPIQLDMMYTKGSCADSSFCDEPECQPSPQDMKCEEFGALPDTVWILAGNKTDPDKPKFDVFFEGEVSVGEIYTVDGSCSQKGNLVGNTNIFIYSGPGRTGLLRTIQFHTSCSKALFVGDRYGGQIVTNFSTTPNACP